jgi:hypothetical protein
VSQPDHFHLLEDLYLFAGLAAYFDVKIDHERHFAFHLNQTLHYKETVTELSFGSVFVVDWCFELNVE